MSTTAAFNFLSPAAILLYTDTDSLINEISIKDIREDMKDNLELYDAPDYPVDNVYGIAPVNKNFVGSVVKFAPSCSSRGFCVGGVLTSAVIMAASRDGLVASSQLACGSVACL